MTPPPPLPSMPSTCRVSALVPLSLWSGRASEPTSSTNRGPFPSCGRGLAERGPPAADDLPLRPHGERHVVACGHHGDLLRLPRARGGLGRDARPAGIQLLDDGGELRVSAGHDDVRGGRRGRGRRGGGRRRRGGRLGVTRTGGERHEEGDDGEGGETALHGRHRMPGRRVRRYRPPACPPTDLRRTSDGPLPGRRQAPLRPPSRRSHPPARPHARAPGTRAGPSRRAHDGCRPSSPSPSARGALIRSHGEARISPSTVPVAIARSTAPAPSSVVSPAWIDSDPAWLPWATSS